MYVFLKAKGHFDNNQVVGNGKFECNALLTMPKEVFEKKLHKKKAIEIGDHIIKIDQIEKLHYYHTDLVQPDFYFLPIGANVKKKTVLQKIKTLYFG